MTGARRHVINYRISYSTALATALLTMLLYVDHLAPVMA